MPLVKPSQIRIRITDGDAEVLDRLAGQILTRTDVASVLLHAAVEAIKRNKNKIHFPPEFEVVQ